jgi:hypothetical protein
VTPEDRLAQLDEQLRAMQGAWPVLAAVLQERITAHTAQLVSKNDEELRGRIKALQDLQNMPETLQQEREGIRAALAE